MKTQRQWLKKLPMILTVSRIAAMPVIVLFLHFPEPLWQQLAALVFILACITDYFDGALARKFDAVTTMGKFMDPIADKMIVAGVLIMLIPSGKVGPLIVILLLCRDILIGGVRAVAAADQIIIAAKPFGKWKTALQMLAIPAIIVESFWGLPLYDTGHALLWVSVILSLLSGFDYFVGYLRSKA